MNYYKKNIKRHQSISKLVDENNNFVATSEICNVLNNYFVNVGPNLSAKIDNDISAPKISHPIQNRCSFNQLYPQKSTEKLTS